MVHRIRDFNTSQDLPLYEAWPGSSRYIQRRPNTSVNARLRQPITGPAVTPTTVEISGESVQLISRLISEGIERGMLAVMQAANNAAGKLLVIRSLFMMKRFLID